MNFQVVSPWLCFYHNILLCTEQMESTCFPDRAGSVCEIGMICGMKGYTVTCKVARTSGLWEKPTRIQHLIINKWETRKYVPTCVYLCVCVHVCKCIGISGTLAGAINKSSSKKPERIIILSLASGNPGSRSFPRHSHYDY